MLTMLIKYLLVAFLCNAIKFSQGTLAPFITKCKADDAACIKENTDRSLSMFALGIPELGVEPLDPLNYDFLDASKPNLKLLLKNVTIIGMKDCKCNAIHREKLKSKLYMQLSCPAKLYSHYELSGEIITIKMSGNDDLFVNLPNFFIDLDIDFKEVDGKDGKKHFHIPKFNYIYDLKEKSEVDFKNLVPENPDLKQPITEIMKSSSNEVVKELGDPVFRSAVKSVVKGLNSFFRKITMEELALD